VNCVWPKWCGLPLILAGLALGRLPARADSPPTVVTPAQITAAADALADAQLAHADRGNLTWQFGTFYAGLAAYAPVSPQSAKYWDVIRSLGNESHWTPSLVHRDPTNADSLCIGAAFEAVSARGQNPAELAPLQGRLDQVADASNAEDAAAKRPVWWWCDALFMAPPVLARMSEITGDPKYRDALDREWWRTANLLYDPDGHLFYRDTRHKSARDSQGNPVFWSRGNGWVLAGLARTLEALPDNYPDRARFVAIYKDMAGRIAELQTPDGSWHSSLLDPDHYPGPETSGTALNCFGLAWGINHGLLSREGYLPVVAKAWAALLAARRPDGLPGYVQGVGAAPALATASHTEAYATGAYLLAASELVKLAPFALSPSPVAVSPAP